MYEILLDDYIAQFYIVEMIATPKSNRKGSLDSPIRFSIATELSGAVS